jgi:NitT/TauT family transport system permease protein
MTLRASEALQRIGVFIIQVGLVALVLVLWQVASTHKIIDPVFFSSPRAVWNEIYAWFKTGSIWPNLGATLIEYALGYLIGTAIGVILGIAIGVSVPIREYTAPFLAFFNSMPRLVLLPLFVVWFGFGYTPRIFLVVSVIVVIVTISVGRGLQEVREDLIFDAKIKGAGRAQLIRHVYTPSIVLWVLSTARVTMGYAIDTAVAAEFIGATAGLGYLIYYGEAQVRADEIFGALALVVTIAFIVDRCLAVVEKRSLRWMPEH